MNVMSSRMFRVIIKSGWGFRWKMYDEESAPDLSLKIQPTLSGRTTSNYLRLGNRISPAYRSGRDEWAAPKVLLPSSCRSDLRPGYKSAIFQRFDWVRLRAITVFVGREGKYSEWHPSCWGLHWKTHYSFIIY